MMYRITQTSAGGCLAEVADTIHQTNRWVPSLEVYLMTHTNYHSYLPPSPSGTTSHLTLSPPPPWTPSADNSRTCELRGFSTSPFIFTALFFSFITSCFIFRGYISHLTSTLIFKCTTAHTFRRAIHNLRSDRCHHEEENVSFRRRMHPEIFNSYRIQNGQQSALFTSIGLISGELW